MRITIVAGTRPNFVKIAPLIAAIKKSQAAGTDLTYRLVHTGQHYDDAMSEVFFREMEIPSPDANLAVGSGTHAEQVAHIMLAFEKELLQFPAELVIVVGDVNSTMACAVTAKKLNIQVAHIEAGIRSYDRTMPEEINRIITDSISDYYFTTTEMASENLYASGASPAQVFFVGNIMIDALVKNRHKFTKPSFFDDYGLKQGDYHVLTVHRPPNVNDPVFFQHLAGAINDISPNGKIIFPIHPGTRKKLNITSESVGAILFVEPLSYATFNYLVMNSGGVITDSGGIQEETTFLNIPCITLRENTERPETIDLGTNVLVGKNIRKFRNNFSAMHSKQWKKATIPTLWDGSTSERIVNIILEKIAPLIPS